MNNSFRFVKGHCGWDTVTLVVGEEVPEGKEVATAHTILDPPINVGIGDGVGGRQVDRWFLDLGGLRGKRNCGHRKHKEYCEQNCETLHVTKCSKYKIIVSRFRESPVPALWPGECYEI